MGVRLQLLVLPFQPGLCANGTGPHSSAWGCVPAVARCGLAWHPAGVVWGLEGSLS